MQKHVNNAKYQEFEEIEERLAIMTEPRLDGSSSGVDVGFIARLEARSKQLKELLEERR